MSVFKPFFLSLLSTAMFSAVFAQHPAQLPGRVYLYPGDPDTAQGYVLPFALPAADNPHRAAVLVCPGGGYSRVAIGHEGIDVARWLNGMGIDAYVLRYRLSSPLGKHYYPDQLNDVKAAMEMVMKGHYNRVGVMGFSAGGHLAGTYLTEPDQKAAFGILMYPVITTDSLYRHRGSFRSLLGEPEGNHPPDAFSIDKRAGKQTPPLFLVHTREDKTVPWQNSELLYKAVSSNPKTRFELYENGPHGFGMRPIETDAAVWRERCAAWILERIQD
jgi:acetyl esterase/lipase